MLPSPSFAFARTFSSLSRHGDGVLIDLLLRRLTRAEAVIADLRDLRAAALDELPDGFLRGLGKLSFPHPPHYPPLVALPEGCAASTVNRFLRELPGTECLSAASIDARGGPIDIPTDTALRLFETTRPHPPLRNAGHVPVLLRLTPRAVSIVPDGAWEEPAPGDRTALVDGLRMALCDDDCRLELPPTVFFRELQGRLSGTLDALRRRLPAGQGGPIVNGIGRPADARVTVAPDIEERRLLRAVLRLAPRELLSAPASIAAQDLLRRLPDDGAAPGLDSGDLGRIARLFIDQWDVVSPTRGELCPSRLPRDLVTLARLQCWTWSASAHAKAEPIDDARKARWRAANRLRADWESRRGFDQALKAFADERVPLPDAKLLRRLGVLQAEALAAQHRARRVSFADPPAQEGRVAAVGATGAGVHDPDDRGRPS